MIETKIAAIVVPRTGHKTDTESEKFKIYLGDNYAMIDSNDY